jgi:hypothetical protein
MARDTRKADIKASLRGIARALNSSMDNVSEELLPEKLATLSERLKKQAVQMTPLWNQGLGEFKCLRGLRRALLNWKA